MSRPRIESIVKMEDARALEALICSNEKAINKLKNHTEQMRELLFNLTTNKNAKQYRVRKNRIAA